LLAAACAWILLTTSGFTAPAVPATETPLPANAGITMAYYRNFFSGSMNHLLQLVADEVEPSGAVVLKSLEARDWWTQTRTTELSRLYALHLHGFLVPAVDGNYRFFADVRGQMRVYLSPDADGSRAAPLSFGPAATDNPSEAPPYNQVSESVALQAGRRYFVRVLFIPGWQERLKILWARQTADGVDTVPELITAAHLRTTDE
jgi:hypothetical protein